jgi:serine O-acetyltransferase
MSRIEHEDVFVLASPGSEQSLSDPATLEQHFAVAQAAQHGIPVPKATIPVRINDVWLQIRATAEDIVRREPLMRPCIQKIVLAHVTATSMLAAALAHPLSHDDLPKSELYALIHALLEADTPILTQATRDLVAVKQRDPACPHYLHILLNLKGFLALQTYRIAHALWSKGRIELAFALSSQASRVFAIDIHPAARIGAGVMLDHGTGIVIGETTVIDDNVSILQNVTLGGTGKVHGDRHPKIRSGVLIGAGAKILGNIEIGAMSKIAAGSVVLKDVMPYCTVAGVPAKVVRRHRSANSPATEMNQMF